MAEQKFPQAAPVLEKYAVTKCKPLLYRELEDCYSHQQLKDKAQDALDRGVAARDPHSVLWRVMYAPLLTAQGLAALMY